jgi:hypothetical protein
VVHLPIPPPDVPICLTVSSSRSTDSYQLLPDFVTDQQTVPFPLLPLSSSPRISPGYSKCPPKCMGFHFVFSHMPLICFTVIMTKGRTEIQSGLNLARQLLGLPYPSHSLLPVSFFLLPSSSAPPKMSISTVGWPG